MKKLYLNEEKYIKSVIRNEYYMVDSNPTDILIKMAQYYYINVGYRRRKIMQLLNDWLDFHYPKYAENKQGWNATIEKIVNHTGGRPLLVCSGLPITDQELKTITELFDKKLERLAFTMLILAKYHNAKNPKNNDWINTESGDIFKMAKVNADKKQQAEIIGEFVKRGLLKTAKKNDKMNLQVTFIKDGEVLKTITDMRELGYQYNIFAGYNDDYFTCKKCGVLVKTFNDNNKKGLCRDCRNRSYNRTAKCVDCGKLFSCSTRAGIKKRCNECQSKINQQKKNEYANKKKSDTN